MRWSEAVTLEFVKIYMKHEALWNPEHPGYKTKYEREKAYAEISSEFKDSTKKSLDMDEVKMKIKNLRTTYMQQVHKILQKSSPDLIYEPSLVWFHEMDRCLKHVSNTRHSFSVTQQGPEVDSSCQIWVDQEALNDNTEESNPDPLVPETDNEYSQPEPKIKREKQSSPTPHKKIKKKKFKHRQNKNPVFYLPDSVSESTLGEDEFDIYGKFIASQLRQMDLQKALRLQLEIQSLVSEARISEISND